MTAADIRNDLREIKYYYSRKENIDQSANETGKSQIYALVDKYNRAICEAQCRLYDMYVAIYMNNLSVTEFADSVSYAPNYVFKLHQQLIKFFENKFNAD